MSTQVLADSTWFFTHDNRRCFIVFEIKSKTKQITYRAKGFRVRQKPQQSSVVRRPKNYPRMHRKFGAVCVGRREETRHLRTL